MISVEDLKVYAEENDIPILLMDGFDDCIIGLLGGEEAKVVYSEELILEKLAKDLGSMDDALDYFSFNIASTYVGIHTPLIIQTEMS